MGKVKRIIGVLFFVTVGVVVLSSFRAQDKPLKIALLKYNGGGDWYANPTSLPNLVAFCNENLGTNFEATPPTVDVGSAELCI